MDKTQALRLRRDRVQAAMERAGFKRDFHVTKALGKTGSEFPRWKKGEKGIDGYNLTRLCRLLGVNAAYLYGLEGDESPRAQLVAELRNTVGEAEATIVEKLGQLDPAEREEVAKHLLGMIAGMQVVRTVAVGTGTEVLAEVEEEMRAAEPSRSYGPAKEEGPGEEEPSDETPTPTRRRRPSQRF